MSDRQGRNKQTALDFYDLMFNQCRTADAIEKYAGTTSRWASSTDLIYMPMPPFHSKSTGAQDGADQLRRCQRPHRVGESERPASGGEDRNGLGGAVPHSPARADEGGVVVRSGRTGQ